MSDYPASLRTHRERDLYDQHWADMRAQWARDRRFAEMERERKEEEEEEEIDG